MTDPYPVRRPRVQAGMEGYDGFIDNLVVLQDSAWVCWGGWFACLVTVSAQLRNMRAAGSPGSHQKRDAPAVSHPI